MDTENVIFLGAGASAPEGAPLQADLFREYFKYQRKHPVESRREMDGRLAEFFLTFFGIDVLAEDLDTVYFPTFEEALGMIDLSIARLESFKNYGSDPVNNIIQINIDLVFLIAVVLDHKLGGECRHHGRLVTNLREQGLLGKTCFVSFNYDILIDNALMRLFPDFGIDYGVRFANAAEFPDFDRFVPLYKIHGSLNWLYCPTCIALSLTPGTGKAAKLVFVPETCATCGTVVFPMIIPPSYLKEMSDYHVHTIWRRMEESLMHAKRFYFCGYSFPDADIHIKYLLKRVEVNGSETPEIVVINHYEGKPRDQRDAELARYRRFFRDTGGLDFREQTFEEFCAEGIVG